MMSRFLALDCELTVIKPGYKPPLSIRKLQPSLDRLKTRLLTQGIQERIRLEVQQTRVPQPRGGIEPVERLRPIAPLRGVSSSAWRASACALSLASRAAAAAAVCDSIPIVALGRSFTLSELDAADSELARPSVFLSYASEDREAARSLRDALPGCGLEVWHDEVELGAALECARANHSTYVLSLTAK
jgi:hypothetical protein